MRINHTNGKSEHKFVRGALAGCHLDSVELDAKDFQQLQRMNAEQAKQWFIRVGMRFGL